jgi:hypothetical protein
MHGMFWSRFPAAVGCWLICLHRKSAKYPRKEFNGGTDGRDRKGSLWSDRDTRYGGCRPKQLQQPRFRVSE